MKSDINLLSKLCAKRGIQVERSLPGEANGTFVFWRWNKPNEFINIILFHVLLILLCENEKSERSLLFHIPIWNCLETSN